MVFLSIQCNSFHLNYLKKIKNNIKFFITILPLSINAIDYNSFIEDDNGHKYETVSFLGEGGSGTVYLARESSTKFNSNDKYVLKISHGNPKGVQNECKILNYFESSLNTKYYKNGVPKCICEVNNIHLSPLKNNKNGVDTAIVMKPYFDNPSSTFDSLKSTSIREKAVTRFIDIVADLLKTGIVSTDLQPLIDSNTGEVLLIDFSEAKLLSLSETNLSSIDELSIQAFLSEALSIIPSDSETQHKARQQLQQRMNVKEKEGKETKINPKIYQRLLEES